MRSFFPARGVSAIDVVVGTALTLVIFMGLFGILQAAIKITGVAKMRAAATSVATSQMEYLRSLEYDELGTVGGIPSGFVPQNATSTNGGYDFPVRTYIEYADDPADGTGGGDTNGITTDYKHIKVTVSYTLNGSTRYITLVSNAVPKGIESTAGGGTLLITVVDAVGSPLSGATVHIINNDTIPAIDVSTFSDAYGLVNLPGAPASTEYQVEVTKEGYSTASTYARDTTNVNPTPGYLTVVEGSTTSGTFAIDALAAFTIATFSPIGEEVWESSFANAAELYSPVNTEVAGGSLILSGGPATYASSGSSLSSTTAPTYLVSWTSADATLSAPLGTSVKYFVADSAGTPLPDSAVPGNSAGFTGAADLTGVSTTTYPALRLYATLTSSDPVATPEVLDWEIRYDAGPTPLPNVAVELTGAKTIGSTAGGASLYKTEIATTTDSTGVRILSLEYDSYTLVVPSYTVLSPDLLYPYDILPGIATSTQIILTP